MRFIASSSLAACVWAMAACGVSDDRAAQTGAAPSYSANSRDALDWHGVYVGTLPCADCEGIRTRIELRGDGSFRRSLVYLGKDERSFEDSGAFTWDDAGLRITLAGVEAESAQRYHVGEHVLFHLDREGQRITGDLAAAYRLEQLVNDPRIENRRWLLIELNGRPIEPSVDREAPYLELDSAESRVSGNASCNRFFGTYELNAGERLRFGDRMGSTMMACPDLDREREFLDALTRVDNYTLGEGVLSLNRARMAPLARFSTDGPAPWRSGPDGSDELSLPALPRRSDTPARTP
jgi:copper homeostasis protein (lipoprotein)